MEKNLRIKGQIKDKSGQPLADLKVKAYDENGILIASSFTDKTGFIDLDCGAVIPTSMKIISSRGMVIERMDLGKFTHDVHDIGSIFVCKPAPADWHIYGTVKDKMSGDPLPGLTVEIFDVDLATLDPLGEDITDAAGEYNVWFDESVFGRELYPDVLIKVRNPEGIIIYESETDQEVHGTPHDCLRSYCTHKGKKYDIEIDYVTVAINMVGPVDAIEINASGLASSYNGINDRPFGGNTTISGRIWGKEVDKWKLYCVEGFIDSRDDRITGLRPTSPSPSGFTKIAEGTQKVWDGPIHNLDTSGLEGVHSVILVVWDNEGNEYHDTQIIFLHNTAITPPAQISSPAPGNTVSKGDGEVVEINGTASDDYFWYYAILWVGPTQTELTEAGISYPPAGNHTPVVNGKLGEWNISGLPVGPYVLRLEVHDRTIRHDGLFVNRDWTWNTITIAD